MALAPAVGVLLGAVLAGVLLSWPPLVAPPWSPPALTVGVGALLTRGLHLDGLADTVDALGSYRRGAAALEIMKKPDVGPFGVVALVVVLLVQAAALAELAGRSWPAALAAVVHGDRRRPARGHAGLPAGGAGGPAGRARRAGRRHGRPGRPGRRRGRRRAAGGRRPCRAARGRGRWPSPPPSPSRYWLLRHLVRRLGGITGDVLGADVEVVTTLVYLGLVLSG